MGLKDKAVTMNGRVRRDADGRFVQTLYTKTDITGHRKAEEALHKPEKENTLILGAVSEQVVCHDINRRIIWANKVAEKMSGVSSEQLSGKACFEGWRSRPTPCEECPAMRVFNTHKPQKGETHIGEKVLERTAHRVTGADKSSVGVGQILSDATERKSLEKRVLELGSKERSDIGHDLHDGLGQYLTGISMLATALLYQLPAEMVNAKITVKQIVDSADSAKKTMRSIIQGLCPVADEPQGLMSALSALAFNVTTLYDIHCSFISEDAGLVDDHAVSTQLFFIAHEAVNNAVKHGSCSAIRIFLSTRNHVVRLSIEDNGCGFSPASSEHRGMGLGIMRYRASIVGATLEIKPTYPGTSITCTASERADT